MFLSMKLNVGRHLRISKDGMINVIDDILNRTNENDDDWKCSL